MLRRSKACGSRRYPELSRRIHQAEHKGCKRADRAALRPGLERLQCRQACAQRLKRLVADKTFQVLLNVEHPTFGVPRRDLDLAERNPDLGKGVIGHFALGQSRRLLRGSIATTQASIA